MPTQKVSAQELIQTIMEDSEIKAESSSDRVAISVNIQETRREIKLTVNGNEVEIIYGESDEITPEFLEKEISRHSSLLELAKSLRGKQYALTTKAVDQEMGIQRALEFVPPEVQKVIMKIVKIIAAIIMLIQFKSPFIQKAKEEAITNDLITIAIFKRGIAEITKQQETYGAIQNERPDQKVEELVGIMDEIVRTLENVVQSMSNALKADLRALKNVK